MDLAKALSHIATAPVRVGLAAAGAGLGIAGATLDPAKRAVGQAGVTPVGPNSVAHMFGLDDAIARPNHIAQLLDEDAPLGRALAPDGPLDRLMRSTA